MRPSPPSVRCAARTAAERRPYLNKVHGPNARRKDVEAFHEPCSKYLAPPVMLIINEFRRGEVPRARAFIVTMRAKIDVGPFPEPSQGRDGAPPPSASAMPKCDRVHRPSVALHGRRRSAVPT